MNASIHKNLYARMKTSKLQLAVCPITGILLSLDIPFIPNLILTYENPFARIDNAKSFAALEYKEQCKVSPHILSGILLTILSHYELIDDRLSSTERNAFISTVPAYHICNLMRFIVSCNRKRIQLFPKLSFSSTSTEYSQPTEVLINYYEVCKATTYNTITEDLEVVRTLNNNNNKSKSSISASTRKTIKNTITTLVNERAINNKIVTLLKLMTQGDNLITMNQDLKEKLISKLRDVESFTNSGNRLADLLEDVEDSMTVYEKQKAEDSREVLNTFSSSLPSYSSTRKSLKEILAEKTNKKIEEAKKDNSFSAFKSMMEEIKEEVMNEELEEDEEEDFEPDFDSDSHSY